MNGQKAKAIRTLRRLSEACRFTGQTIEIAVLQTQTLEKQGRRAEALDALDETVAIAAPGGWVRPFVEAGELMAGLLDQLAQRDGQTDRLKAILDGVRAMATQPTSTTAPAAPVGESRFRESLTRRELDTLALVAQRLQNKEIAARLFVSVDTVKTHLKNLYSKLEVGNRREAAAKAVEILAESQPRVDAVDLVDNP